MEKEKKMCRFDLDLTGKKFNRWTVIKKSEKRKQTKRGNYTLWECKCSCGNERTYCIPTVSLERGYSKSCGCLQKETTSKRFAERIYEQIAKTGTIGNWNVLSNVKNNLWKCECVKCRHVQNIEGGRIKYRKCDNCKKNKIIENENRIIGKTIGFLKVLYRTDRLYLETSSYYYKCHCNKCNKDCEKVGAYLLRESHKKNSFVNCGCSSAPQIASVVPKMRKNNTSGITGVWFRNDRKKWYAGIMCKGIKYGLGSYDTMGEAALARQIAEEIYHKPILREAFSEEKINTMYKNTYLQKPKEFQRFVNYTWSKGIRTMDIEISDMLKDFERYRKIQNR